MKLRKIFNEHCCFFKYFKQVQGVFKKLMIKLMQ